MLLFYFGDLMLESNFKKRFKERLVDIFPDCVLVDVSPSNGLSFPDLLVLIGSGWAAFETKRGYDASRQPNQDYYIELFDSFSYGRFVYPGNLEEILDDIQRLFKIT